MSLHWSGLGNFLHITIDQADYVDDSMPRSKQLLTDVRSNVFVYLTGRGGNEFLKFQDNEEIGAFDIADALSRCGRRRGITAVLYGIQLLNMPSKVQRASLHDRHVSGEYDVLEHLFSEHLSDRFISVG